MNWTAKQSLSSEAQRHSPCIGTCRLDAATGLCLGCARTADEISNWRSLDAKARFAIWEQLPGRHATQSRSARLMPLTPDEILFWAAETVEKRLGGWAVGMPGAIAEFMVAPGQTPRAELREDGMLGWTETGALRIKRHPELRAISFQKGGPVVLGVAKARIAERSAAAVTKIGPDAGAIFPGQREDLLFDYGLGRKFSGFCIRTRDEGLIAKLLEFEGQPWRNLMAGAGAEIMSASPHRVAESSLARIEVYAPIPKPDERSPNGAHTHFLPAFLAAGEEVNPRLALPDHLAPIAAFFPARNQTA